jgi:hypothetical protein
MRSFMFWNSISRKIFIAMVTVAFCISIAAYLVFVSLSQRVFDRAMTDNDNAWRVCISQMLSAVGSAGTPEELSSEMERILENHRCIRGIWMLDENGNLVCSWEKDDLSEAERYSAKRTDGSVEKRDVASDRFLVIPLPGDGGGVLRMSIRVESFRESLAEFKWGLALGLFVVLMAGYGVFYILVSNFLRRPIRQLLEVSTSFENKAGDLRGRIEIEYNAWFHAQQYLHYARRHHRDDQDDGGQGEFFRPESLRFHRADEFHYGRDLPDRPEYREVDRHAGP